MLWTENLTERRMSGAAHMFTLHLGVTDRFVFNGELVELKDVLLQTEPLSSSTFFAFFNRGTGIQFTTKEMEAQFLIFLSALKPSVMLSNGKSTTEAEFLRHRREVEHMLGLFSEMLEIAWTDNDTPVLAAFKKAFPNDFEKRQKSDTPFFSVALEYEASISPHGSLSCGCAPDRDAIVTLLTWGVNKKIADAHNTVLLITEHLDNVAEELAVETNGIVPIEIPFLSRSDREETVTLLVRDNRGVFGEHSSEVIGRISAGMTRRSLSSMVALSRYRKTVVTERDIFSIKKKHLEEQGRGMITIQKPIWGPDAIGGLDDKKDILQWVASAMTSGDRSAIPQGIGFFGGPGLGKTVCAQVLAYMTSLEVITLQDMMSMFVGESERNTTYTLKKVVSYGPAVVVMDEFDTAFQRRGSVYYGDAGVSARQMQKFLDIMSDTDLRGYILWIILSNRPQDIDDAFLRPGRLDLVLPFLPPSTKEQIPILGAILHKLKRQTEVNDEIFRHEVDIAAYAPNFAELCHGHHDGVHWIPCDPVVHHRDNDTSIQRLTGAEMECIITNGNRDAKRKREPLLECHLTAAARCFKPTRDMAAFNRATEAALRYCNDVRYIPETWREEAWKISGKYVDDTSNMQISMSLPGTPETVEKKRPGQYL
ncbi:MAG: AAA ATPase [Parcubacteria group bacterium Gr01-1014_48]|nr:MAG: AAA ATPase [Parcubacteria group bacterium Greene0416_14]TSC71858.1 MAG: AAA ATPase [Parcubacteria group bacterium Gr01-1014_48]TSC99251.1 MAG: AAA ATPase [Parcubacteria group bacterium Greene1014_15]TSD07136.1 MAG: AAA ATPase [Parcubacteria group bacterium Greene0714_4]